MSAPHEVRMMACVSLDGFIAREGGEAPDQEAFGGWTSAEDKREFWRELRDADLVVAGRRTLEQMPALDKPMALVTGAPETPLINQPEGLVKWCVGTHHSDVFDFVHSLPGKRMLLCGGAMTYDLFLRWNLVDRLVIIVEPVMLKKGIKLIASSKTQEGQAEYKFVLLKCTPLNSRGTVRLDYRRPKP